jgi:hypothetical protein
VNQSRGLQGTWGQAAFLKYKNQPVPDKAVAEKVACPRFGGDWNNWNVLSDTGA